MGIGNKLTAQMDDASFMLLEDLGLAIRARIGGIEVSPRSIFPDNVSFCYVVASGDQLIRPLRRLRIGFVYSSTFVLPLSALHIQLSLKRF